MTFTLKCPDGSKVPLPENDGELRCNFTVPVVQTNGIVDLIGEPKPSAGTANHYSTQWGPGVSFLQFIKSKPEALKHMPSGQLGWPALFSRIREQAKTKPTMVLDACCGYGGIFTQLFADPIPPQLRYLGADVHRSLSTIERPSNLPKSSARFIRWDVSNPVPIDEKFDFVICRNAVMITPDPPKTFKSLASVVKPGGTIAVSIYSKKALVREILDDALRDRIVPMSNDEALAVSREFSLLGKDMRAAKVNFEVKQDLPFFGIKAGKYDLHDFFYYNIMKCWHNELFGDKYSDIVNFDWYHPPYTYRFSMEEILAWFAAEGIKVTVKDTIPAQHYVEGVKA